MPLTPSGLTGEGVTVRVGSYTRQPGGYGQRVVHHRAGEQLAVLVVDGVLVERLADALRDAAVHLARPRAAG